MADPTTNPFTYPKRNQDFFHLLDPAIKDNEFSQQAGDRKEWLAHMEDKDIALEDYLSTLGTGGSSWPIGQYYFQSNARTFASGAQVPLVPSQQYQLLGNNSRVNSWDGNGAYGSTISDSGVNINLLKQGTYLIDAHITYYMNTSAIAANTVLTGYATSQIFSFSNNLGLSYDSWALNVTDPAYFGIVAAHSIAPFLYPTTTFPGDSIQLVPHLHTQAAAQTTIGTYDVDGWMTVAYIGPNSP